MRPAADLYFNRSQSIIRNRTYLDTYVTYRTFMRKPGIAALSPVITFLLKNGVLLNNIKTYVAEGEEFDKNTPLFDVTGRFSLIVNLETEWLQKVGSLCSSALKAKEIIEAAGNTPIIDMHARHNSSSDSALDLTYAAKISGFIGTSIENPYDLQVMGTIPHALIGIFNNTVDAAKAFRADYPNEKLIVLVDYFGKELTDSIDCFKTFGNTLYAVRIDTPGERYCEGSDKDYKSTTSYHCGKGVTIESVKNLRKALDSVGGHKVKIIVSSGFNVEKIRAFKNLNAPMDIIGTGTWPADPFSHTATADIISYNGTPRVKVGREWLLKY